MEHSEDKKSVIKDLIEQGKKKGKLSAKELMDALEELDLDSEQIDKLYDTLENMGIGNIGGRLSRRYSRGYSAGFRGA
jgi:RNA polymerase primary sigma factor